MKKQFATNIPQHQNLTGQEGQWGQWQLGSRRSYLCIEEDNYSDFSRRSLTSCTLGTVIQLMSSSTIEAQTSLHPPILFIGLELAVRENFADLQGDLRSWFGGGLVALGGFWGLTGSGSRRFGVLLGQRVNGQSFAPFFFLTFMVADINLEGSVDEVAESEN